MKQITAIGEILYDIYPTTKNLGGAPLNFLYHVFKLTGQGNIVSRVGKDILGQNIIDLLNDNGISILNIQEDHHHPTGVTTVKLNEKKEPSFNIDEERAYDFIEKASSLEKLVNEKTDCLYFGTLAQRNETSRGTIQSLLNRKIQYFCDLNIRQKFYTKEIIEISLKAANVLKVNNDELKLLNELFLSDKFEFEKTCEKLIKEFNIEMLAVTLGGNGSRLFKDGYTNHYKTEQPEIVDTVGAGDAFASVLCIGYMQNIELKKTNKIANEFAAEICMIEGALPKKNDVYELIKKKIEND